ncbi:hypothetical protein D6C93_09529 [Aureobasidium pullulans]|nr:hypothetical protein D6C93_09529 [Aureobasidium pullulans]
MAPSLVPRLTIALATSHSASGSLASTFGDFHTPSQGSAMKFLNAGSTAEGSSTKRSSLSPVKPVGSGFSLPSRVSAPLVQGPVFSTDTDTDPNTLEERFVCFDLIPEQWTQDSAEGCVLNRALEYTGLIGLIDTAVGSPSEVPGFVNIFCRFDGLRAAAASMTLFKTVAWAMYISRLIKQDSVRDCHTMSHLPTKMERQDSGIPADNRKTLQSAGSSAWLMYTSRLMKQALSADWLDRSPRPDGVALEWISTFNTFSRTQPMDLWICNERCRLWRVL